MLLVDWLIDAVRTHQVIDLLDTRFVVHVVALRRYT